MTVAFIGHRKIDRTNELIERLEKVIGELIENENADTFLFGSGSEFNDLCYEIVSKARESHPFIRRVWVRAEYEYINKEYTDYLLSLYEDTFFAERAHGAGALVYIKRNMEMIDRCDTLVVYFDENYSPKTKTKSGTKMAVEYACRKKKRVINLFDDL